MNASLKKVIAEFIGTFVFLLAVAGATSSGSPLKQISIALVYGLLILTLGGISGGFFNPAVSLYLFAKRELSFGMLLSFIAAQLLGAFFGMVVGLSLWEKTISPLTDGNLVTTPIFVGEVIATAGLVFVIGRLLSNKQSSLIWVGAAAWLFVAGTFTVTGAMANPAVSFGLMFNGISTGSIASIIVAQLVGLVVAIAVLIVLGTSTKKATPAKKAAPAFVPAPVTPTVAPSTSKASTKTAVTKKPAAKKPAAKPVAKAAPAKKPATKKPAAKATTKK